MIMGGLFGKPKAPPVQHGKTVRMATEQDPEILAATQRTKLDALRRAGRQSTILTDALRTTTGSSGQKLGA